MATHIFLVDADTHNAVTFGDNVSAFMNARVTIAHSSIDAMTLVAAGVQPDVALIAWHDRDSVQLVRALREHSPHLPVILVFEDDQRAPRSLKELDVQGTLTKPFHFPQLPAQLMRAMDPSAAEVESVGSGPLVLDQPLDGQADYDVDEAIAVTKIFNTEPDPQGTDRFESEHYLATNDELSYLGAVAEAPVPEPEVEAPATSVAESPGPEPEIVVPATSVADMLDEPVNREPVEGHIELTQVQIDQLLASLADLSPSLRLGSAPLLLSQDGALISHQGVVSPESAAGLARLAGRVWREGATRPTREWLSYNDRIPAESGERRNIALYSLVVAGDLTVSVAWDGVLPLATVRADARRVAQALESAL